MKIGILGFQGAVIEHIHHIEQLGHNAIKILYPHQLEEIDGIIIPGGESTTIGKLLVRTNMLDVLRNKIEKGMPVWGTCAGMILLAKTIEGCATSHLATMDICVKRNAYGTQIDSFSTSIIVNKVTNNPIPLIFIRAPYITKVNKNVEILCSYKENIVAAKQDNMLVTSFHPELSSDSSFHSYFLNMCKK